MIILQTAATGAFDLPNRSRGSHDLADLINVTAFHSPMLQDTLQQLYRSLMAKKLLS